MRYIVEEIDSEQNDWIVKFTGYVCDQLGITRVPVISFVPSLETNSFGVYKPGETSVTVATNGRHIADILRTFAHELVHHVQLSVENHSTIEELEYEANAVAGMLMRDFNKLHPELYGVGKTEPAPGTIADVGAAQGSLENAGISKEVPYGEGGIDASNPLRPPYPIEMAESINAVGAGHIASVGYGPNGEPGVDADDPDWHHAQTHIHSLHGKQSRVVAQKMDTKSRNQLVRKLRSDEESRHLKEEAPVNAAGSGAIAGIGVGPQGEPGFLPRKKKKTPMIKRKTLKQLREELTHG